VIGGQVQMMIDAVPAMAPNIGENQVRALATSGKARSSVLPNVPTITEAGVPGYEATIWLGLMAPTGTPKPIIDKLNTAVNDAVKRPDIVKLWTEQGAIPMSMTPEEFDKFLRGDIVKWAEVVKKFDKP
jgi:tripartite-type tricarboxylate transporter receptor subunit TctC